MKKILLFISFIFLFINLTSRTLSVGTAEWFPFAYNNNGEITGIAVDLIAEISKKSKIDIDLNLFPANRLNLLMESGKLDINIADSPLWNSDPYKYVFTDSYLNTKEYVYYRVEDTTKYDTVDDLKGKRIGIVLGYYYESLEDLFINGEITKVDAPNEKSLFEMLKRERVDAAIFDEIMFNSTFKGRLIKNNYLKGIQLTNAPICFKISKQNSDIAEKINKILIELVEDGTFERILNKYLN